MKTKDFIFIAVLFYVGWFGSVFIALTDFALASLIFPLLLLVFLLLKKSFGLKDLIFVIGISIVGIVFDFFMVHFGFVSIFGQLSLLIPIWLVSIWFLFALSMVKLAPKLQPPFLIATALGGIMGPLSYKSGEYFQVLLFTTDQTFLIYAIFWAIAFPIILKLSKRLV